MIKGLVSVANKLDGLGLTKDADFLDNLIRKIAKEDIAAFNLTKMAFINEARIKVDITSDRITATLVGKLPSGRSTDFGKCYAINLTDSARLASSPSSSIWEFHRAIRDPEYSGLGYMNDLLITVISQIQNNGGVAFNGIGSYIVGSGVSEHGRSHTLGKLDKSLIRTPVITFFHPKKKLHLIFEPSDRDLAKREFLAGYGFELPDGILDQLFSTPYKELAINQNGFKTLDYKDNWGYTSSVDAITSGFKIVATSAKTSIPVSPYYSVNSYQGEGSSYTEDPTTKEYHEEGSSYIHDPTTEEYLRSKNSKFSNTIRDLEEKYFNLFSKSFPLNKGDYDLMDFYYIFGKITNGKMSELSPDLLDSILENFIQTNFNPDLPPTHSFAKDLSFNKEKYLELKPEMHSIWSQIYNLSKEREAIRVEQKDLEAEYRDRRKYVGKVRNRHNY